MRTTTAALLLCLAAASARANDEKRGTVDLVFCIDRSGSMQEVIETAKKKVWGIVNEIAGAKPAPVVRIGLIGYGSADRDIKFFPLSSDLDKVYEHLLTFQVDMGGDEWVGWALQQATERMAWSADPKALKLVFMVGNETARQGREDVMYTTTAPRAIRKGIQVNAVYCGTPSAEEERTWKELASLADGSYSSIELSGGTVTVATPMDPRLLELNRKLNGTYLAFGRKAEEGRQAQELADAAASKVGGAPAAAARAEAKSKDVYSNSSWDLVDAAKEKTFDLRKVAESDLPEEMRKMNESERRAHLEKKAAERKALQEEIVKVARERQAFIDAELERLDVKQDGAFDKAVQETLRRQAEKKGFTFEKK
jgi:hypothetical protein